MSDKRLLVNAGWNYSATIVEGVVGIALVTYITRHIAPAAYGLALFTLGIAEIFMLFDIGLFGLLPRGYLSERVRPNGKPMQLVGSALIATSGLGILGCIATIIVGSGVVWLRPGSLDPSVMPLARSTIVLTGVLVGLMLPGQAMVRIYEAEHRFRLLSGLNVTLALVRGALTIILVGAGLGPPGIVIAVCVASALRLAVLASPLCLRKAGMAPLVLRWDWQRLRSVWRLGGWALADNVAHHVSFGVDNLVLFALSSSHAVALYGVALKIPLHAGIAVEKAVAVALPAMAEQHVVGARNETARLFVVLTRFTFAVVLPVAVIVWVVATPLLLLWVGPAYAEAATTLRWLLASTLGISIAVPCITALYAVNAVETDAKIASVEAVLNLGLTVALVPKFGAPGAAAATAITHLATTYFMLLPATCAKVELSKRVLARQVLQGVAVPLACSLAVLALAWGVTDADDHLDRVLAGALAGAVYFGVLWLRWRPRVLAAPVPS